MHYTFPVRERLEGKANLHRPARNCRSTRQTLEELDEYLGEGQWEVIHFNWGIHDVTHMNQEGKGAPPPEGTHQVPLEEYERNVQTLVRRLKQTGARLIWASTTPIGSRTESSGFRRDADVVAYNAVAAEVMRAEDVIVNDLYALVKPRAEKLLSDGVHFTAKGCAVLAGAVAGAIQKALEDPREEEALDASCSINSLARELLDASEEQRELISSIGSERATSGGNKIVTSGGSTYIVWQDATDDGSYFNRLRSFDHTTRRWSETFTLNQAKDNHSRPVLSVDGEGYLHVFLSGHNSPVTWRRSVRPGDASQWTDPEVVGKGTYTKVMCGPDNTLYVTMRSAKMWQGEDFYVKPPGEKWEYRGLLVKKQSRYKYYASYHPALAWGPTHKTLHMSTGFYMGDLKRPGEHNRDPQGLHQAVGYMRSDDFGQTWTKADGTP
ncbi:unnamed protein product, partial [marine sediment metagenome]